MAPSVPPRATPSRPTQVRNQIFLAILVALLLFFVASYIDLVLQYGALRDEIAQATAELQNANEKSVRLEKQLQYVQTDAYKETIAREQLGLIRPGDVVVAVLSNASQATYSRIYAPADIEPNLLTLPIWRQWLELFNLDMED